MSHGTISRGSPGCRPAVALERGELDVVATREITRDRLASWRILPMRALAVMRKGHPLAAGREVKVQDLLAENLMPGLPSFTSRMLFDAACSGFDTRPRIVLVSPRSSAPWWPWPRWARRSPWCPRSSA